MNKQQRFEAMKRAMGEIDEEDPSLIIFGLARQFDLPVWEVHEAYWAPTKQAYARQRSESVGSCHYCGMPATGFGFFDEPVCEECGG